MVGSRKYSLSRVERVEGRKPSPSRVSSEGEAVVGVSRSEREMAEVKVGARVVFRGREVEAETPPSRVSRERWWWWASRVSSEIGWQRWRWAQGAVFEGDRGGGPNPPYLEREGFGARSGGRSAVSRFEREGERGGGGCVATASRGCT